MEGYKIQYWNDGAKQWVTDISTPYEYYKTLDHMIGSLSGDAWVGPKRVIDDNGVVVAVNIGIEQRYNTYAPDLLEELRRDLMIEPDRFRQLCLTWLEGQ